MESVIINSINIWKYESSSVRNVDFSETLIDN